MSELSALLLLCHSSTSGEQEVGTDSTHGPSILFDFKNLVRMDAEALDLWSILVNSGLQADGSDDNPASKPASVPATMIWLRKLDLGKDGAK